MNMLVWLLSVFCTYHNAAFEQEINPIVQIENGKIRGRTLTTINNTTIYAFLEIPYASPPLGDLRFKEAVPPNNWDGILNTTKNTKICWERDPPLLKPKDPRGNEDCLYINVFTSKIPINDQGDMAVMVYFHGGTFNFGDGTLESYNPQLFVENDIVCVTFNSRSGPLGYLTTEDRLIPANLGLKDQNLALKWVRNNIRVFGGDPSKVTIFGHSSGGEAVSHHILSKKSAGLFRSAIQQSGTAISVHSYSKAATYLAYALGEALSPEFTSRNNSRDLLELLKKTPADVITNTNIPIPPHANGTMTIARFVTFGPVIEDSNDENAFITGYLHDDIRDGNFNKVPLLTGIASEEALFLFSYDEAKICAETYDNNITTMVSNYIDVVEGKRMEFAREMKKIYTNDSFQEDMKALYQFVSDVMFCISVIRNADLQVKYTDVYFYQFSYYGNLNKIWTRHFVDIEGLGKVGHPDMLAYILYPGMKASDVDNYPKMDILTRNRAIKLFSNFIKYTNPTPLRDPLLQNISWPKVTADNFQYLDIDVNLSIRKDPREYKKWIPLIEKYYKRPIAHI